METIAEKYFTSLTPLQRQQLSSLEPLYQEWNRKINVISRKDIDRFEVNHLLHSLAIARFITFRPGTSVIDIGTGGGLPGIPLAILFPEVRFTLVDSTGKKISVASAIAAEAGLDNVTAIRARAEELTGEYHFITGRGVTETGRFIKMTQQLKSESSFNEKKNGWILLKGGEITEELRPWHKRAEIRQIRNWFDEPWFESKMVVYIPF